MFHDRRVFSKIPIFTNIVCHHCKSPLVGGLEHEFYDFPYIGNVIITTDFHSIIFQRGRSTTNQYIYIYIYILKSWYSIWLVISPPIIYGDICHHCKLITNSNDPPVADSTSQVGFDPIIEHRMMAGCDILLMPSQCSMICWWMWDFFREFIGIL